MYKQENSGPLISVLVPCYNVEKYLRECIDSIRSQTYKNLEIICINDGSTDSTAEILRQYADIDRRIRVITKENSGYGHSMNIGLSKATGEYLGIVESDDFIEPHMFETLIENALKNNLDISRGSYFEYKTEGKKDIPVDTRYVTKNRVIKPIDDQSPFYQPPSIWCAIYKREFLNKNEIRFLETPGASYQDTSFAFKCYLNAERFMMIEDHLLHYRTDNINSSVNNPKKIFCICDEYNEIWRYARRDIQSFEKVRNLIPVLQFAAYKWNFNRLSGIFKRQFLRQFHQEFKHLQDGKLIDQNLFSRHDRKIFNQLLRLPILLLLRSQI